MLQNSNTLNYLNKVLLIVPGLLILLTFFKKDLIASFNVFIFLLISIYFIRVNVQKFFVLLFTIVLIINGVGWQYNFYDYLFWFDEVEHFLTTLVVTLNFGTYIYLNKKSLPRNLRNYFSVFTLGASIGLFWEFYEFAIDYFLKTNTQVSLQDTMTDLALDCLGAVSGVFLAYFFYKFFDKNNSSSINLT